MVDILKALCLCSFEVGMLDLQVENPWSLWVVIPGVPLSFERSLSWKVKINFKKNHSYCFNYFIFLIKFLGTHFSFLFLIFMKLFNYSRFIFDLSHMRILLSFFHLPISSSFS